MFLQDSLCISISRELSSLEKDQLKMCKQNNIKELPNDSLLSKNLALAYLDSFSNILDWSCLDYNSHVYKTLIRDNKSLEQAHFFLSKFLKARRFRFKDELKNRMSDVDNDANNVDNVSNYAPKLFVSPSAKQYIICGSHNVTLMKKIRGISRKLSKYITTKDFINVTIRKQKPRKILQFGLKRIYGKIYCHSLLKAILGTCCTKRIFSKKFRTKQCSLSFPLHLKDYVL